MGEIITREGDLLLSRDELRGLDHFQSRLVDLEREFSSYGEQFQSILNRHYFNRENGFLEDQQGNLREVVVLQSRVELLAGKLGACSAELKSFMMALQNKLHGELPRSSLPAAQEAKESQAGRGGPQALETKPAEAAPAPAAEEKKTPAEDKEPKPKPAAKPGSGKIKTALLNRTGEALAGESLRGGEISLKLLFDELKLGEPGKSEILNRISAELRKLLYDRKLVGYSKTSLVFGKDKSLAELLKVLKPIFLAEALFNLLLEKKFIDPEEKEKLELACNENRELIYSLPG